ncbi:triphosphoribosyl-dephospho-CoA synthase [Cryobacterium sp. AP23]
MTLLSATRPTSTCATDDELADAAVNALIDEALLTPKPALVDRRGAGVHEDMNLDLMVRSALSLRETFRRLSAEGRSGHDDRRLRTTLAAIGRDGERTMMAETDGVNTHRGAIWALGLAIAARAALPHSPVDVIAEKVGRIATHDDDSATLPTRGSLVRQQYGVGGAIAQARAGFPHAVDALHVLSTRRAQGAAEDTARLDALLTSIAHLDDTCILGRGGTQALTFAQVTATAVLTLGGSGTAAGAQAFARLDAGLALRGVSPGGSADMLALALFLDTTDTTNQDH